MKRREFLAASAAGGAAAAVLVRQAAAAQPETSPMTTAVPKGRLKHSVCRWCYGGMHLEALCHEARAMGISSVELVGDKEWPTLAQHGLTCAVAVGPTSITRGLNRVEEHAGILARLEAMLPKAAAAGCPMMIVFSGNRAGMGDAEGLRNCAAGLKEAVKLAELHGVTLVMELLNSKVDHGDYMCDRTPWGAELVERVGSDRFKLLYDIYHMQIMEGDVIRTVREHMRHIAHFHTAGVPGRNEIEGDQELNYRAICAAIADAGFAGFIAQEFIPKKDGMASLRRAVEICTV